ncbi:lactate utilization protein [Candidatus Woesebacteria bacterium]|nr:lactate utilization protein [Candidatus Woesebacteria bacterium]
MKYNELASKALVERVVKALKEKGYGAVIVTKASEALSKIKEIIPDGASVMNGSSVTLEQIGYLEYLKSGEHKWIDLHAKVNAENDKERRAKLRRESVLSDYYLGSVHALAENGEFVIASNTGSQMPHIVFTSPNLIFVISTKKIVPTLSEAMKRLEEYVYPLENKHMMDQYNVGTNINKVLIFRGEVPILGRKIRFILVEENLGF